MSSASEWNTQSQTLLSSSRYQSAKKELLAAIAESSARVNGVRPPSDSAAVRDQYKSTIQSFNQRRGRDLYFPFLASGLGSGPFVELLDGSVKYDMITGIGINLFGHSHPELMAEMIDGLGADIMQGNLQPGIEAQQLVDAVLARVGQESRLKHCWLTTCGTMANENSLKIIRQKKAPATKVLAFKDCFAGRSTAMQEITDNPKYRDGQPVYGEVHYLPFYDPKQGEASTEATIKRMREHLARYPGKFAALMIELVQGEGGFNYGPREFYVRVFDEAKKAGLAIWVDEIQTFGRTGELFAYQSFGLEQYVDVVTVAKAMQSSLFLFTEEFNPKPGLVAGTFSGSSTALRASRRVLEMLSDGVYFGKDGQIARLSQRFLENFERMAGGTCRGVIPEYRAIGGMIAVMPFKGTQEDVKAVLLRLFDLGVVAFSCGHDPYLIRMLPPLGVMSERDVDAVCGLLEQAILAVAKQRQESSK
jgi:acetylornithine/N-succinyldiaminopimelate aminotransferase